MFIVARNHRPGLQSPLSENWVQHQPPHRNVMRIKTDTKGGVTSLKSPLQATVLKKQLLKKKGEGERKGKERGKGRGKGRGRRKRRIRGGEEKEGEEGEEEELDR